MCVRQLPLLSFPVFRRVQMKECRDRSESVWEWSVLLLVAFLMVSLMVSLMVFLMVLLTVILWRYDCADVLSSVEF